MSCRSLPIYHGGELIGQTPMLVPAFSGSVYNDIDKVVKFMEEFITDQVLISAYDIHYKRIKTIPTYAKLIFIDSGGYEISKEGDLSELGNIDIERKERKNGKKLQKWKEERYSKVIKELPSGISTSHIVVVSYDHPSLRQSIEEQVTNALRLLAVRNDILKEILLKPETTAQYLPINNIIKHIELLQQFDIIGLTEKELGSSTLDRMVSISTIRKAMDEKGIVRPLHVFGSLDTVSTPLYFIAGADIFDGLTWLRYSFIDGLTVYWQNYGAKTNLSTHDKQVRRKMLVDNIYYLSAMRDEMLQYSYDKDFSHFKHHSTLFKDSYGTLLSRLK
jgi:queuine/archaeosine tRNA-ribosyltransferase